VRRLAFLTLEDRADFVIDDALAIAELETRQVRVDEIPWTRGGIDWRTYDGVVIRTTWDYQRDVAGFFALLDEIERMAIPLANPASLVRWNAHKTYLADLAGRGVPTVPTRRGRGMSPGELCELPAALGVGEIVLKPAVGANADDTYRVSAATAVAALADIAARFADREWMAQPFLSTILDEGEVSTFHFNGRFSHAVIKRPKQGDFRVQEEHGGLVEPFSPDAETRRVADGVLAALGEPPLQARVDLVRLADGSLALMELEAIEPSLYFRMHRDAPRHFADAVEAWLARVSDSR
jgi:glutathione synthase/RimK-type ligase-like ATP-grasp enzyme